MSWYEEAANEIAEVQRRSALARDPSVFAAIIAKHDPNRWKEDKDDRKES